MACSLGTDVYSRICWLKKYVFIRLNTEEVHVLAVPPTARRTRPDPAENPAAEEDQVYVEETVQLCRVEDERRQG